MEKLIYDGPEKGIAIPEDWFREDVVTHFALMHPGLSMYQVNLMLDEVLSAMKEKGCVPVWFPGKAEPQN